MDFTDTSDKLIVAFAFVREIRVFVFLDFYLYSASCSYGNPKTSATAL